MMLELSIDELCSNLKYEPETGEFTWMKRRSNILPASVAGVVNSAGYVSIRLNGVRYLAHRLAWLYMTGEMPLDQIDHVNHVKSDNRWRNLRAADFIENARNRTLNKSNTSGVTGVCWLKTQSMWQAQIRVNYKTIRLGAFPDKDLAIAARKQAEMTYGFHNNHGAQKP